MQNTTDTQSGWQLTEDGPNAYEKYIVPAFSADWADDIIDRAQLKGTERILDLGCGTGIVSRQITRRFKEACAVTGVDINGTVLAMARQIAAKQESGIVFEQADAAGLPFPDNRFNVVFCQQGLQYFPDKPGTLREIRRILVPGGRTLFSVWRPLERFPFYCAVHDALIRYVNKKSASMLSSAFCLGDMDTLKTLFNQAGFIRVKAHLVIRQMRFDPVTQFIAGGFSASPFSQDIRALSETRRNEMFADIIGAVSPYLDDDGLAAPMESWVVSAVN